MGIKFVYVKNRVRSRLLEPLNDLRLGIAVYEMWLFHVRSFNILIPRIFS